MKKSSVRKSPCSALYELHNYLKVHSQIYFSNWTYELHSREATSKSPNRYDPHLLWFSFLLLKILQGRLASLMAHFLLPIALVIISTRADLPVGYYKESEIKMLIIAFIFRFYNFIKAKFDKLKPMEPKIDFHIKVPT